MAKKILIVEDVIDIAESIKKYLLELGYEVSGIISFGEDAVALVQVSKPDLILMDIDLAGEMDGIEAAETIYSRYHIPIVFVTANDNDFVIERASTAEPFGYILKPFDDRELRVTLEMAFFKQKIARAQMEFTSKIEKLHHTALEMSSLESEEDIYQLTVESLIEMTDVQYYSFYIKHKRKLLNLEENLNNIPVPFLDDDLTQALARKTQALNQNIMFGKISDLTGLFIKDHDKIKSGICIPIFDHGILQLFSDQPDKYSTQDLKIIGLLVNYTNESLQRLKLQRELKVQAIHDPLTKTYNRFFLYSEFEKIRSGYFDRSVAFIMVDVNNLKYINDHYGHQVGDEVLVNVAGILVKSARSDDIVIRYGGDEFLLMLPDTGEEVALIRDRILTEMKNWNREHNKFKFEISFAVGTAFVDKKGKKSLDEILTSADKSMYKHKREIKKKNRKGLWRGQNGK